MGKTGDNECRTKHMNISCTQTALLDEIQQDQRQWCRLDEITVRSNSLLELRVTARTNPNLRRQTTLTDTNIQYD
jgi:hypothetical protein